MNARSITSQPAAPRGMTLLEVLIACGVLVLGLSSVAALMPAAGARLGQANLEDRAATLAANAYADVVSRGLTRVDLFADPARSLAFGKGLADVPLPAMGAVGQRFAAPQATLFGQRIAAERDFSLEDEVLYEPSATAATPTNEFDQGRRAFKDGACWGATVVPTVPPGQPGPPTARAGSPATLSIAVFRKQPQATAIPLTTANGVYRMTTPNEAVMKKFLRSCSHVIVSFKDSTRGPRWFRILASWRAADGQCYVAFDDAGTEKFADFAGTAPVAIGFDGLVRLDEYNVILK